jgi:hypothetical protein
MPVCQRRRRDRSLGGTGQGAGSPTRAGRGDNHAGVVRAIARACLVLLLLIGLAPAARAQATPDGNPLVQRDVPAEATAENAVVARDRALAAGQRIAYERMAAQLGMPRSLPDQQIEALVSSLVIESERITPRGYVARITVNFRPPGTLRGPLSVNEGPEVAGGVPAGRGATSIEALASYRSFAEYAALKRQLAASPAVARVEVLTVAGDRATLRIALRREVGEAAGLLADRGVQLTPANSDPTSREGWRLSLGGR